MRAERDLNSERKEVKPLFKHSTLFNNGMPTTAQLMRSPIVLYQISLISEISMDLTSLIPSEIRVLVVLATLCHSPKSLSQDLSNDMAVKFQFYHHNTL